MESVRLRSVPVQPEAVALPRRAAVLTGKVDAERATAHAYVVFAAPEQAQAALAHNMVMVRAPLTVELAKCWPSSLLLCAVFDMQPVSARFMDCLPVRIITYSLVLLFFGRSTACMCAWTWPQTAPAPRPLSPTAAAAPSSWATCPSQRRCRLKLLGSQAACLC